MTNPAHHNYLELSPDQVFQSDYSPSTSWWQRQTIRFKTTVLAIAIGTIPTLAVGTIAYYFAAGSIQQENIAVRKALVGDLQNQVNLFMSDRFKDIKMMATLPIFSDPKFRNTATAADKSAALQKIQDAYGIYNSIAVFDPKGDFVAKTDGKTLGNHLNRTYIQAAIKADGAVISQPTISTTTGVFSVYTASPIKDRVTGKTVGYIRARIPVTALKNLLKDFSTPGSQYYLLSNQGEIFVGSEGEYAIKTRSDGRANNKTDTYQAIEADEMFNDPNSILTSSTITAGIASNNQTNTQQFLAYAPGKAVAGLPQLNWQAILATDTAIIFAPQKQLRLVFLLGSSLVALGVGVIAYALANRLLRPIIQAADAVQEIGAGDFTTRLPIKGTDEIAQLSSDINQMAVQLAHLVQGQTLIAQQSQSLKNIALKLANAKDKSEILQVTVQESYQVFNAERLAYYQFIDEQTVKVVAEHVALATPETILHTDLPAKLIAEYSQQKTPTVEVINNVAQANLSDSKQQYLNSIRVKSCLIAPVIVENKLDGLLMVHQSVTPLPWLDEEIEFVTQLVAQIAFSLTRLKLSEQQKLAEVKEKSAKEAIQIRALSLLQEVYDVSEGDLTIRARVTDDEIGTIADSYNSTIESLQKLVNQTKAAATEVKINTSANDEAVQSLAAETVAQAEAMTQMLNQVKDMAESISLVSTQASQAEKFVQQAASTIDHGDKAMNRTVAEINAVQHTVVETASKAEKLGESSQEISQAVNLISRFAAQTHLLALKASIEAARAGEQGKGFAVIADEVRSLATQSAEATSEIETLVSKIQLETVEVVTAMNQGAEQIASGNKLVQQTRQSLTQVTHVSNEISKLVGSITQATAQQSATTVEVNQTIAKVATIAQSNSQSATRVSASIRQLSQIAEQLQSNIDKFKT